MIESRFMKKRTLDEPGKSAVKEKLAQALAAEPSVVFAYVHGSFVKEEEFRDVDVAVFAPDAQELHFESDLSLRLSTATGLPVEVCRIDRAPVAFQMAAVRDGVVLLCRSEEIRTDFIEDVGTRYREYGHFRNLFLQG